MAESLTLFLGGDVMTGRGVDQILPHPGDPALRESHMDDAQGYVRLVEEVSGPLPCPVDYAWPWGDAVPVLRDAAPHVRVINLETAITTSDAFAPGKAVHYRMNPSNVECLRAIAPDVCVLANNHVLDFGPAGLVDTLDVLERAGLRAAGAGRDECEANAPAIVALAGGRRALLLASGATSSGIPREWAAGPGQAGVALLPARATANDLVRRLDAIRRPGDVTIVSLHWGSNWGYQIAPEQRRLAQALVDGGVDVVHGHSSHHPRPIEIHHGKLILYGCGDLVDDYEGIRGYEQYRDDLRLLYLATVAPGTGEFIRLRMVALRSRQMRLERAGGADAAWLCTTLDRVSRDYGTRVDLAPDGVLIARPM